MASDTKPMKIRCVSMTDEMWDAVTLEAEAVKEREGGVLSRAAVVRASLEETLGLPEEDGAE